MFLVKVAKRAIKSLERIPVYYRKHVNELLVALEKDAIPSELFDVKKLHGREDEYRIRIGDIRVLYAVFWDSDCIEITDVNWRGRAYK